MAIEQILERISEDARLEARNIVDVASKQADEIIQALKKEAAQLKDKIIASAKASEEATFQKEVVASKLMAQKEILELKKSQMDDCFKQALEALLNLDSSLYQDLIKKMLEKIDSAEEAEITFSLEDKSRITQAHIHKINGHLKLSFADNIQGGFILKSKELIIDNSFNNILDNLRQDLEPKVAAILFKE